MWKQPIKFLNPQTRSLAKDTKKSPVLTNQLFKSDELKDDQSYISTSQAKSMIRFHRIKIPKDETKYEREYRLKYEQVQLWNHDYWLKNNELFQEVSSQVKKVS